MLRIVAKEVTVTDAASNVDVTVRIGLIVRLVWYTGCCGHVISHMFGTLRMEACVVIAITPWDREITDNDECCRAGDVETRDLARGMAGALFVSLPLLFTMEMWQIARTIPDTTPMKDIIAMLIDEQSDIAVTGPSGTIGVINTKAALKALLQVQGTQASTEV